MRDVHVHFLHGAESGYTFEYLEGFIETAVKQGLEEMYLLEHTHQFYEFAEIYKPIREHNEYQNDWLDKRMNGSISPYIDFINTVKGMNFPVKIKFGLEVCYIPETCDKLKDILDQYNFDFLTGSVHWIDCWGFDHTDQKESWENKDIYYIYKRYYTIMCELCKSGLFTGLAHPDSIKCFGHNPKFDLTDIYNELAINLKEQNMYAENSGGLHLNYSKNLELGLNAELLSILKKNNVRIFTASDAHKQSDVGAYIKELESML